MLVKQILMVSLSGVMVAVSFPPFGWWPLVLVAWAPLLMGLFRPGAIEPGKNGIRVSAVQSESCSLSAYLSMSRDLKDKQPGLVVWPEYAVPYDIRRSPPVNLAKIVDLANELNAIIVLGTKTAVSDGGGKWYNTALGVDGGGIVGEYHKNHPVHFFNDGLPSEEPDVIETSLATFGTPICFDFDYSLLMREMTLRGAEFFAIPSFDAKRWSVAQHLQHSAILPVRAVENGRWIVCAPSSGISQVVDPHGNIHHSIAAMEEGVITGKIERRGDFTFYIRIGWFFPWLCMAFVATGFLIVSRHQNPKHITDSIGRGV
jgi:apolipoprotein N-acyltransferase